MSKKSLNQNVKIKKLANFYALPEYKSKKAAAMDLYAAENAVLETFKINVVKTGIAVGLPPGHEAQVRCRSGLAVCGVTVVNSPGTVDEDFCGEICVILSYIFKGSYSIKKGERIAQLVISPVVRANLIIVDELDETVRGTAGFGSTGK